MVPQEDLELLIEAKRILAGILLKIRGPVLLHAGTLDAYLMLRAEPTLIVLRV